VTNGSRPFPFPPGGPFTCVNLTEILERVLTKRQLPPSRRGIEQWAFILNDIAGVFRFSRKFAGAEEKADRVSRALETLSDFFEERRGVCCDSRYPADVVESERALYDRFWAFFDAMAHHSFELDMDAVVLMPEYESWHDIAVAVASSFRLAMAEKNPHDRFGFSNDGPVARFVAEVVPMITGETPRVETVAQHLKRARR